MCVLIQTLSVTLLKNWAFTEALGLDEGRGWSSVILPERRGGGLAPSLCQVKTKLRGSYLEIRRPTAEQPCWHPDVRPPKQ